MKTALAAAMILLVAQTFRSGVTVVSVNVAVRSGNVPVRGLTAADFDVTDNGVRQRLNDVSVEAVPIDVSLVLDTSGSTGTGLRELMADAQAMSGMLRPVDRFRLLTLDTYVHEVMPMRPARELTWPSRIAFNGASAVYDALGAALMTPVDVDRRHLIVAMTDGADTISTLEARTVTDIAARSDAVLHMIAVSFPPAPSPVPPNWLAHRENDLDALRDAAQRTGGELHSGSGSRVASFESVFDGFREGYLLRYTPAGVRPDGWHAIDVKIARSGRYSVRARRGYVGATARGAAPRGD